MNPFELITDDEVLYQMCQGWDDLTLRNMSVTYARVYRVCKNIREKRLQEEIKWVAKSLLDLEKKNLVIYAANFTSKNPNESTGVSTSLISMSTKGREIFIVQTVSSKGILGQHIVPTLPEPAKFSDQFTYPIEEDKYGNVIVTHNYVYKIDFKNLVQLKQLIAILHSQGYFLQ